MRRISSHESDIHINLKFDSSDRKPEPCRLSYQTGWCCETYFDGKKEETLQKNSEKFSKHVICDEYDIELRKLKFAG